MSDTERRAAGFSLLEVLVATAVLSILVAALGSAMLFSVSTVSRADAKIDQFGAARAGFERLTATLSQATLNTYWAYDNPSAPQRYERQSDLHFLIAKPDAPPASSSARPNWGHSVYFQAPLSRGNGGGAHGLLNAVGYWVAFGDNDAWRPNHVSSQRARYRLMQGVERTENLSVFNSTTPSWANNLRKLPNLAPPTGAFPLAENVVALLLWPRLPIAQDQKGTALSSDFLYDSKAGTPIQRAQMPPMIQITLVVIDEASAARMENGIIEPTAIVDALSNRFMAPADYEQDLQSVQTEFALKGIQHLVLSAAVPLRESKWSR
jgi:uncharacterized protein (TIGR02599 family)